MNSTWNVNCIGHVVKGRNVKNALKTHEKMKYDMRQNVNDNSGFHRSNLMFLWRYNIIESNMT